jgi:hypothetical protein
MREVPEYNEEYISKAKDRIKDFQEKNKQPLIEKIREKYARFGSLPRCIRITIVADAEHMGEKYPFYNTFVKPGEEEEEGNKDDEEGGNKKKKQKKLFYPSVRIISFK